MRTSPSIVPHGADLDTYLVLDDFGRTGCSWRETDAESADRKTLIRDLLRAATGTMPPWTSINLQFITLGVLLRAPTGIVLWVKVHTVEA